MVTTHTDVIAAVRALVPAIRDAADETERNRRPTPAIIKQLSDARLFDLVRPRSIGGLEVDVVTMMRVIEEASTGDGSIGWCLGIGIGTSIVAGSMPEHAAREIFAPGSIPCGAFAPTGRAQGVDGGFRVSGRWAFASGSPHCHWFGASCVVLDGDKPRMVDANTPETRMLMVPRADFQILDTWHVSGLRGTGSNDITVSDAFVPAERAVGLFAPPAEQLGPLYRYPIIGFLALTVAPVATGIARRAIDEAVQLAQKKTPLGASKTVQQRAVAQHEIAQAEAALRSSRAFMYESAQEAWDTLVAGDAVTLQQRAMVRLACTHATAASVQAVDIAYRLGGGTSIYETSVLQRQMRDVHAITQHIVLSSNNYESVGRVIMGLDPGGAPF